MAYYATTHIRHGGPVEYHKVRDPEDPTGRKMKDEPKKDASDRVMRKVLEIQPGDDVSELLTKEELEQFEEAGLVVEQKRPYQLPKEARDNPPIPRREPLPSPRSESVVDVSGAPEDEGPAGVPRA